MKSILLALPLVAFAATATWSASAGDTPATDTVVSVDYTFRDLPLNSMGVKSFADLRGKPVIIDFWGKN
jgi:hypothetical protein